MTYIPKPLKIVVSGRSLCVYEYDKNYIANQVDNFPAICAKFDPNSLTVETPHGNKVYLLKKGESLEHIRWRHKINIFQYKLK